MSLRRAAPPESSRGFLMPFGPLRLRLRGRLRRLQRLQGSGFRRGPIQGLQEHPVALAMQEPDSPVRGELGRGAHPKQFVGVAPHDFAGLQDKFQACLSGSRFVPLIPGLGYSEQESSTLLGHSLAQTQTLQVRAESFTRFVLQFNR